MLEIQYLVIARLFKQIILLFVEVNLKISIRLFQCFPRHELKIKNSNRTLTSLTLILRLIWLSSSSEQVSKSSSYWGSNFLRKLKTVVVAKRYCKQTRSFNANFLSSLCLNIKRRCIPSASFCLVYGRFSFYFFKIIALCDFT